jgi:hypothetical protein
MGDPIPKLRTHEPTLLELTAELDGLTRLMEQYCSHHAKLEEERDKRYQASIEGIRTQTAMSFAASEKAIEKAENNAEKWRDNSNEWRTAMNDREIKFATKPEVEAKLATVSAEIASLNISRSGSIGVQEGTKGVKDESRANIAIIVSIIVGLLSFIGLIVVVLKSHP